MYQKLYGGCEARSMTDGNMSPNYTPHQKRYFAEQLTLSRPAREIEAVASSMSGVKVDLNPHQVDAALFALRSPISNGSLLADEVGLGKTIEAGLVLAQYWAERRQRVLLILPASLRTQWKAELEEKFGIPCTIIERPPKRRGVSPPSNLFLQALNDKKVAICSYEFAAKCKDNIAEIPWDLVIIDEAHRLRNIYRKTGNQRAKNIKQALRSRKKLLLTATPLQNNLREMYGLATIIDEHLFGDAAVFADTPVHDLRVRLQNFCKRTLRKDVADTGYIKFTRRQVITRPFTPKDTEQKLYDQVSEYLQRDHIWALPSKGRQLVTMVIRKLLASSSAAVSKTLQSLIDKLEALREEYEDNLEGDLSDDFETFEEYSEEHESEDDLDDNDCDEEDLQRDKQAIQQEQVLLKNIKILADSIPRDAKLEDLLMALEAGFAQAEKNVMQVDNKKGTRKAVIFTESTRTQQYILDRLNEGGYEGQIVLLNGSNNDDISKRIYAEWKERHKNDDSITGSKAVDMKAAIVEEFRDRATILIGTEAAAEGINLQFCNMVVNYDLPWNPQRIEQRIGRCHRYGQRYDVVVVNFVNQNNAADKRVYELLEQKFNLFEGVFGSSDDILGALESGIDFERSIFNILQSCRTAGDIDKEFDKLQQQYAEVIEARKEEAVKQLLLNFGEDVVAKLRDCEVRTRASLTKFERWKFNLFTAFGATRTNNDGWAFDYNGKRYIPSWEDARVGGGTFLASNAPVYTELLDRAKTLSTPVVRIRFNYSAMPATDQAAFAFFRNNRNLTGAVSVDKLTYTYGIEGEKEEHIIISVVTVGEAEMDMDMFDRMMEIPARVIGTATLDNRLEEKRDAHKVSKCGEIDEANKKNLVMRLDELAAWRKDREDALSRELNALRNEIELKQRQRVADVATLSFQDIVSLQGEINNLNDEIDKRQRQMLASKDDIKKSEADLQAEAMRQLNGLATIENIMAFSFEIA